MQIVKCKSQKVLKSNPLLGGAWGGLFGLKTKDKSTKTKVEEKRREGERRKAKVKSRSEAKIPTETKFSNIINVSWISIGLRV